MVNILHLNISIFHNHINDIIPQNSIGTIYIQLPEVLGRIHRNSGIGIHEFQLPWKHLIWR